MVDILLETIRAVIVGLICVYLVLSGRKEAVRNQSGWHYLIAGFALTFFGMLIDITDNFPALNKYIIIGDTEYQAILEKVVGYLFGSLLICIGFWKWMPTVIELRKTKRELKESHEQLEVRVRERTEEILEANSKLKSEFEIRRQTEKTLEFQNIILLTQQETTLDGILVVDAGGKMISFNLRFVEMWHIPDDVVESRNDELAIQSVLSLLKEPEEFTAKINYLYSNKTQKSRDEILLIDGRVFDRYSSPMFGPDDQYLGRVWYFRDITDQIAAEEKKEVLIKELENALSEIKTLSGLLPICSSCKKIRDDKGSWNQIEVYIRDRSDVDFSHGICPNCAKELYPEYYDKMFSDDSEGEERKGTN